MRRLARSSAPVLARWMALEQLRVGRLAFAFQIRHLAADHAAHGAATRWPVPPISRALRSAGAGSSGQHLERQRQQRIARQNRHGVAEYFVVGELAAAVIVVIERRQIVVDQRVGVDQFERAGGRRPRHRASPETARAASMHRMGRMRLPPANRL